MLKDGNPLRKYVCLLALDEGCIYGVLMDESPRSKL